MSNNQKNLNEIKKFRLEKLKFLRKIILTHFHIILIKMMIFLIYEMMKKNILINLYQ